MYENFKRIIEERNITPYRVSIDTGINQNILSYWKSGRSIPKIDKLKKISLYLGVPIEELIGTTESAGDYNGNS